MGSCAYSRLPLLASPPPCLADGNPIPGDDFFATLGSRVPSIGTGDSVSPHLVTNMSRNAQPSSAQFHRHLRAHREVRL